MNKYQITTNKGETVEIETKKTLTAIVTCDNDDGYVCTFITSSKNPEKFFQTNKGYNRPWLSNWELHII